MGVLESKEKFVDVIHYMMDYINYMDSLNSLGISIDGPLSEITYRLFNLLMEELSNDSNDIINWWLWEAEEPKEVQIKSMFGTETIELKDAEDLYEYVKSIENANRSV